MATIADPASRARELLRLGKSLVLQMPTGSGKTFLAFEEMARAIQAGKRAVYLCPLRALARETFERARTNPNFGSVGVFTGDQDADACSFQRSRLLVMTPERLDACTRAWRSHWTWIPEVDLIVIDELHLLGDPKRGARLDGAISRFRRLNPFARLVGLSATLGNRQDIAEWLNAEEYESRQRTVHLSWKIVRYADPASKPSLALDQVASCASNGGQSLVFVQSRRRAEQIAELLKEHGLRVEHHHGGLTSAKRQAVEQRCRDGSLDAVVATATLEMGLNLPVRQVLLYDLQRFDGRAMVPLDVNSVWQRAGRAGRPGLDTEGEVVLLASTRDKFSERYIEGNFEAVTSPLSRPNCLSEQIVAEVASGLARTPLQLTRALQGSFASRQTTLQTTSLLGEMLRAEMISYGEGEEGTDHKLRATRLGKVASRHMLSPATVAILRDVLRKQPDISFTSLAFSIAACEECEPHLFVDFEELGLIQPVLDEIGADLSEAPQVCMRRHGTTGRGLLSAAKAARLVKRWTSTGNMADAAESLGCYEFEGDRLRESFTRLLLAMLDLAGAAPDELREGWQERLRACIAMVTGGLDARSATLTLIDGVGVVTARKLKSSGIEDVEDLALAEPCEVISAVGGSASRAEKWISAALDLVKSHGAFYFEDSSFLDAGSNQSPLTVSVDPYRLRRAISMRVAQEHSNRWVVSGGTEPRVVSRRAGELSCDCPDFGKGNQCKHILAVRLRLRDAELKRQAHGLQTSALTDWNAQSLWMDRDSLEVEP